MKLKMTLNVALALAGVALAAGADEKKPAAGDKYAACHQKLSPALVMEWQRSRHGQNGVG